MSSLLRSALYRKLQRRDSFRLLELNGGCEQDPIVCDLLHIESTVTALEYECISYVWGDPNDTEYIQCRPSATHEISLAQNPPGSFVLFPVTMSLASALRLLRFPNTKRVLWADGICIDQKDDQEKGHQVALMETIYGRAGGVAVWLGQSDENTQPAIELMNLISDRCQRFVHPEGIENSAREAQLNGSDHFLDYLPDRDDHAASTNHDPRSQSLDKFFGRPWFRRVWVIQEVAKCQDITVHCGNFHFSWNLVSLAAVWCLYGPESYNMQERFHALNGISNANFMHDKVWQTTDTVTFLHLIGRGKDFDATDPRDKVYAMLSYPTDRLPGASNGAFHFQIEPDYSKTISEVYSLVAIKSIQHRRDLEILSYVDHGPALNTDSPSWIPRWDRPCTAGMLDQLSHLFDAGGVKSMNESPNGHENSIGAPLQSNECSLTLSGFKCGVVQSVTNTMNHLDLALTPEAAVRNPLLGSFRQPINGSCSEISANVILGLNDNSQYDAEFIYSAYARTLTLARTCGTELSQPTPLEISQHTADFASYIVTILDLYKQNTQTHASVPPATFPRYISGTNIRQTLSSLATNGSGNASLFGYNLGYACLRRKFFKTTMGHIGIGPAALDGGDIICVLRGGRMIYALRERDRGWAFIGDCYVHGLMNGELLKVPWPSGLECFRLW